MDATLPDLSMLRPFYAEIEVIADIEVAAPHATVRQVVGAPTSKGKLINSDGTPTRNFGLVRDAILRRFIEDGRPRTLVVAQLEVEGLLRRSGLPAAIALEHFNNLSGIDHYRDVELLIVVGRTLPDVLTVEALSGAITGIDPLKTEQPAAPPGAKRAPARWYDRPDRVIRTTDGAGYAVKCDVHPDPVAESLRFQIAEAEVLQCLGRGRAINRTSADPLAIEVWSNLTLPLSVNQVLRWSEFQAGADPRFEMIAAGVLLESATDMAAAWPEVWKDRRAADNALARAPRAANGGTLTQTPIEDYLYRGLSKCSVSYQREGSNQKHRAARFDLALIPDPRAWLEARLGPLAHFEVEMPESKRVTRLELSGAVIVFAARLTVDEAVWLKPMVDWSAPRFELRAA